MSRFFIERPIFASVIAIVIMIAGALAIGRLPIEQYPSIAPPAVQINGTFPGASAQTVETSVTQVIEQQLTGLDHLIYFSSNSSSNGSIQISATFAPGTNPDIAQVQVQNKLQQAVPLLPVEVQLQGLNVAKSQSSFLMVVALYDTAGRYSNFDIADYMNSYFVEPIGRVNGVGAVRVFGDEYALRIWLDPFKLDNFKLMPSDVSAAVLAQNVQVTAGEVGGLPSPPGQELDATITAQSLLRTPDQFRQIILKTQPDGSIVRLGDVARVELGADDYSTLNRLNGRPAAGTAIQLAPGANALATADLIKARARQLAANLPPGMALSFPVDSTTFIKLSLRQVVVTLVEAIFLVIAVMYLFLQNWRVTLIPGGGRAGRAAGNFRSAGHLFGYTINTLLTMFAVVLAIGLLVDDAIVVVENVERDHERGGPRAQGRHGPLDGGDHRSARWHRPRPFGRVLADGLFRRLDGSHLPPVFRDHRLGDGAFHLRGPDPDASLVRNPPQAGRAGPGTARRPRLPLVQHRILGDPGATTRPGPGARDRAAGPPRRSFSMAPSSRASGCSSSASPRRSCPWRIRD